MLCLVAYDLVKSKHLAEEIVDDVFFNLWQKRNSIEITKSIRAYLVRSVKNRSINWLEQTKTERLVMSNTYDVSLFDEIIWDSEYPLGNLLEKELSKKINDAVMSLPEHCRQIFLLNRNEDLTYEEIAQKLAISVNTVKTQMKIALSKLREALKDYLPLILILLMESKKGL
jgi:RNA polymerase sigma-70 factor (ECF subfamily)